MATSRYLGKSIRQRGAWDLVPQGLVVPEKRSWHLRAYDHHHENLQMGATIRDDKAQIEADIETGLLDLPAPEGTRQTARRHDERRRQMLSRRAR